MKSENKLDDWKASEILISSLLDKTMSQNTNNRPNVSLTNGKMKSLFQI